jgi:hypothetical protein
MARAPRHVASPAGVVAGDGGRRIAGVLAEWPLVVRSSLATIGAASDALPCALLAGAASAEAVVRDGRRDLPRGAPATRCLACTAALVALAVLALLVTTVAPASAEAGVYHRAAAAGAVAVSAARHDPATRTFTVRTRGHATGVTVCDLSPATWCVTARPISAPRWVAELPTGPVAVATAGGFPEAVGINLGADPQFTVAVVVYQRPAFSWQRFTGSYEG